MPQSSGPKTGHACQLQLDQHPISRTSRASLVLVRSLTIHAPALLSLYLVPTWLRMPLYRVLLVEGGA